MSNVSLKIKYEQAVYESECKTGKWSCLMKQDNTMTIATVKRIKAKTEGKETEILGLSYVTTRCPIDIPHSQRGTFTD